MGNLKQSFRESRQLGGPWVPINPAVRAMLNEPNRPGAASLDIPDYRNALEEPSTRARRALNDLFLQAQGKEWRGRYEIRASDAKPIEAGSPEAIQAYAGLICEHVECLNSLIQPHRELLLPFSRRRASWPVLKSKHPYLSEDEKTILTALEVGNESGRHLDRQCKWKPVGKIACLVDELIEYVAHCKKRHAARHALRKPTPGIWAGFLGAQLQPRLPFGAEIFAKPLCKRSFETAAARLKPLSQTTIDDWEQLIVDMLESCFADADCAKTLIENFVTAPTKRKSPGRAKQHLIRRVGASEHCP